MLRLTSIRLLLIAHFFLRNSSSQDITARYHHKLPQPQDTRLVSRTIDNMKFFVLFLLAIGVSIGIASHFLDPASLRPVGNRAAKDECSKAIWQSHMIPELLSVYWSRSTKFKIPANPDRVNSASVSHNRTSTDGEIHEEDSKYRVPSYLNYEYTTMNGGIIMEEKPAGFTLLETKPWVSAELAVKDDQE